MPIEDPAPRTPTILVVDDDLAVRTVTVRALQMFGYATLQAGDGAEGLEVFRSHADAVACVLLDLTMPRLDGLSAARQIAALAPATRIILMTGYAEDDAREKSDGLDIAAFLEKPFDLPRLRSVVDSALAG